MTDKVKMKDDLVNISSLDHLQIGAAIAAHKKRIVRAKKLIQRSDERMYEAELRALQLKLANAQHKNSLIFLEAIMLNLKDREKEVTKKETKNEKESV